MQEDENQPEEEQQPLSGKEAEEKQPEQEQQPISGDAAGASQAGPQPPPAAPTPLPLTQQEKRRQYFLGLGFGLIPMIVFLVTWGIGVQQGHSLNNQQNSLGILIFGVLPAILLYFVELIVTLFFLAIDRVRFVGYGLLTAVLASPVIAFIGCTVIGSIWQ